MRRIRDTTMTTPSSTGSAPPDRPEPDPRATHGAPCSVAAPTHACTSSAVSGRAAAPGSAAYCSSPSDS